MECCLRNDFQTYLFSRQFGNAGKNRLSELPKQLVLVTLVKIV